MKLLSSSVIIAVACGQLATAQTSATLGAPDPGSSGITPVRTTSSVARDTVALGNDYTLRTNDVVSVIVFQEPDLECLERVAADGTISMPLVGRIRISGRSPLEAAQVIESALRADYLVNPQVTLAVTEANKEFFTVLGAVAKPGTYVLPPGGSVNLLQAIGVAGGFTRVASPSRILVKRSFGGSETLIKANASKQAKDGDSEAFQIKPGDVITVKERLF